MYILGAYRSCPVNKQESGATTSLKASSLQRHIKSLRSRWPIVMPSTNESFVDEKNEEFYESFESALDLTYQQPNRELDFGENLEQFPGESMQTSSGSCRTRPVFVLSDLSLLSAETKKRYENNKISLPQVKETNSTSRFTKSKSQTTLPAEKSTKPLP